MTSPEPSPPARRFTRRQIIGRGLLGATAVGAGLLGYTTLVEPFWWQRVDIDLDIEKLPPCLDGRRLVQISDLHIGHRVDEEYIRGALEQVAELKPDLIAVTGDVVDYRSERAMVEARRVLQAFPHGRLGSVAILGNHDYGIGWNDPAKARAVETCLRDAGVDVLRNRVTEIEGLQIAGLDDLWAHRFDPASVVRRIDPQEASLALSHNPDTLDQPGWGEWRGWVLSGHTHGGQCKPPFLPPPLLPVRNRRYTRGAFEAAGRRRVYINAGLGYLRQVRFNVRPEVTVFTLRRA